MFFLFIYLNLVIYLDSYIFFKFMHLVDNLNQIFSPQRIICLNPL